MDLSSRNPEENLVRTSGSYRYTKVQIILEATAACVLAASFLFLLFSWNQLPDQIPAHYNMAGVADRYGDKTELLFLPLVSLLLWALLTVLQHLPRIWNIPVSVTPELWPSVRRMVTTLLLFCKAFITALFFYILVCSANGASLNGGAILLAELVLLGVVIGVAVRIAALDTKPPKRV